MLNKDLIIQLLQKQLREQTLFMSEQSTRIKMLEDRISYLENNQKKDSSNSSKPPSTDIGKAPRTQSLRMKSGKKPGGQQGHVGETLFFSETPNEVVIHGVNKCNCCGKNLLGSTVVNYEKRQVLIFHPSKC
jgi:transposase